MNSVRQLSNILYHPVPLQQAIDSIHGQFLANLYACPSFLIRVIQRGAYGIKNQEYLMLKVITSFIKEPKSG